MLIGHSYGGMVATGVADRVPERISQLIYLDAFVPRDGQSLLDLQGPNAAKAHARAREGWRGRPASPAESAAAGYAARRSQMDTGASHAASVQVFRDAGTVSRMATRKMPHAYIYALRKTPADTFKPFADRAKQERWDYREIDASHSPHVTAPEALAALLNSIMAKKPA